MSGRRGGLRAGLQLARPANVVTALADVLAGAAAALTVTGAEVRPATLAALLASTAGLYAGGVVLNDWFDAALDARERPERPIPSGRVSRRAAGFLGSALLAAGVAGAAAASAVSAGVALAVAALAVLYDGFAKRHAVLGPPTIALCRAGNLLLGVSVVPAALGRAWGLALLPLAYVTALTALSRGEVFGGRRAAGLVALVAALGAAGAVLGLGVRGDYDGWRALPFALVFAALVLPPLRGAARVPEPARIRAGVRAGVVGLIPLDAALAAGFGGFLVGLATLALLPVSLGLARRFAVT